LTLTAASGVKTMLLLIQNQPRRRSIQNWTFCAEFQIRKVPCILQSSHSINTSTKTCWHGWRRL